MSNNSRMIRAADSRTIVDPCLVADTIVSRFKGLMGKPSLAQGHGLLIEPCNSIHTFFMRFAIDVVYLCKAPDTAERSQDGAVKRYLVMVVREGVRPWRMDFPVFGAKAVLELPVGGAANLREGDTLCLLS